MKKVFMLLMVLSNTLIYSQAASKINNAQNVYSTGQPRVIVSCDTLIGGLFRTYPKAQVTWNWNQILVTPTTLSGYGIVNGVPNNRTINGYTLTTDINIGKTDVGLGNVDNTSDLNKPISTATQSALDTKLSSINSSQIITALGYSPINPNGTNTQYIAGDGTKITFPVIPTNNNQLLNGSEYITTIPAQSFASITGKPSTLSGYGINDAYPLTGNPSNFINQSQARTSISLTTTGTGVATYNNTTGVLNIPTPNITIPDYYNTSPVSGGAGNVIFYITSDKTSTGTALYNTIDYVNPVVNDSAINYTYGWSYNAGTKALTVNVKSAAGIYVGLLSLTLLGTPVNVANGTSINVLVKGH